jgi:hypothetical protein
MVQIKQGRECSLARVPARVHRRRAQRLISGEAPVVSRGEEVDDDVRRGAVILRVRLPTSIVSCRGGGGRLEQARAARCFCRRMDASSCSANEQMEVFRGSAVTREKGWEEEEGTNLLGGRRFRPGTSAGTGDFGEKFRQPGGVLGRRSKGGMEEDGRGYL